MNKKRFRVMSRSLWTETADGLSAESCRAKMGHAEGCKVLEQTVRDAADLGIDYLTVMLFPLKLEAL